MGITYEETRYGVEHTLPMVRCDECTYYSHEEFVFDGRMTTDYGDIKRDSLVTVELHLAEGYIWIKDAAGTVVKAPLGLRVGDPLTITAPTQQGRKAQAAPAASPCTSSGCGT